LGHTKSTVTRYVIILIIKAFTTRWLTLIFVVEVACVVGIASGAGDAGVVDDDAGVVDDDAGGVFVDDDDAGVAVCVDDAANISYLFLSSNKTVFIL
jgi:hypothetical protein